jgi:hypothetical protein
MTSESVPYPSRSIPMVSFRLIRLRLQEAGDCRAGTTTITHLSGKCVPSLHSSVIAMPALSQHHHLPDHAQIVMQNALVVVCARLRESDSEMRRIECYRIVRI